MDSRLKRVAWIVLVAMLAVGVAAAQEAPPLAEVPEEPATSGTGGEEGTGDPRLQATIDRLTAALSELESLEAKWLANDKAENAETKARLEEVAALEAELAATERRSAEMDALYDRVNPLVEWSIGEVRSALQAAGRPSELPGWAQSSADTESAMQPFGDVAGGLPSSESTERLEDLQDRLSETSQRLQALEIDLRVGDVRRDTEFASRIYRVRLRALDALTLERSARVFSWTSESGEAIQLEKQVLELVMRLQWFQLKGFAATVAVQVRSLVAALLAGRLLVRILIVLLLWRWVQRGRARYLRRLHRQARKVEDPARRRWALQMSDLIQAVAPWGLFILGVISVGWVFDREVREIPFLLGAMAIVLTYGLYRLAVDLLLSASVAGMEGAGLELTDELRLKLHVAIRWVARAATPVGYVLWMYSQRLGGGVLYSKVRTVGFVFVLLVVLVVVARFRVEVREMFLALRAHGRLADLVRGSADTWTAYLVTPIAFVWLCGRGVVSLFRGITHSFERTRRASAYLSRRRMAKVAEQRGRVGGDLESLPPEVLEALDERITPADAELLGGLSNLDVARESVASWREGAAGGSLLLAGEEGLGKTAWLESFLGVEGDGTRLELDQRLLSPAKVRNWLAQDLLESNDGPMDREELIERICAGPRRIVTLEGAENLFLATVNGYRALAEIGPIIDGTRKQIFWLMTIRGLAWNHLRAAGKELTFLRRRFVLEPRDEGQIEALIDGRMARGGFEARYADLMAVEGRKEDETARNKLGKQTYMNLLWDFSGGNPQVALHFFLRSLEYSGDGVLKVWLPETPSDSGLTEIGDEALFLVAAVMRHHGLNVRQAATTTNYPVGRVEGMFLRLLDLGAVVEEEGIYNVPIAWRMTVLRVLRRRNILVS